MLATVKGDVHDIGKNLVDIILTNNGYEVHNLGTKVAISEMVSKAEEVGADVIGMSGLLVKSTLIMRDNLLELNERGLDRYPVILGGAALTRSYVEKDLRAQYKGRLFYGKDAFEGLRTMDKLMEFSRNNEDDPDFGRALGGRPGVPPRRQPRAAPRRGERAPATGTFGRSGQCRPGTAVYRFPGRTRDTAQRDRQVPERDFAVPQPVGLPPAQGRDRRPVQDACTRRCSASSWSWRGSQTCSARR